MPKTRTPSINSEVAIGRRMKGSEMLTGGVLPQRTAGDWRQDHSARHAAPLLADVKRCRAFCPRNPGVSGHSNYASPKLWGDANKPSSRPVWCIGCNRHEWATKARNLAVKAFHSTRAVSS